MVGRRNGMHCVVTQCLVGNKRTVIGGEQQFKHLFFKSDGPVKGLDGSLTPDILLIQSIAVVQISAER